MEEDVDMVCTKLARASVASKREMLIQQRSGLKKSFHEQKVDFKTVRKDEPDDSQLKLYDAIEKLRKSRPRFPDQHNTSIVFDFRGKNVKSSLMCGCSTDMKYPEPCGILFEGENVKVGKGALLVTRDKKLRIQFREKLTSTFEYPSESSYIDDLLSPPSPAPLDSRLTNGDDGSISQEPQSDDTSPLFLPSATLKSTPALGSSGGLASYTPSMLTSTEGFQLGVSRCIRDDASPPSQQQAQKSDSLKPEEEGKEEMLKPANPEDTSSWSSSTDTSDLLF